MTSLVDRARLAAQEHLPGPSFWRGKSRFPVYYRSSVAVSTCATTVVCTTRTDNDNSGWPLAGSVDHLRRGGAR
jgi:hypothetical protein